MKINKQLFEDVLSGKLKGTFVLKNKQNVKSNTLKRSSIDNFPYKILIKYDNGITDYGIYKSNGNFETFNASYFDIINFIPADMKEDNELTIEIPDGKIVDWEESKKQNKIILKDKQLTYEDICKKVFKDDHYSIAWEGYPIKCCSAIYNASNATTEHQLECILAKNKLATVAKYLNDGWKPLHDSSIFLLISTSMGSLAFEVANGSCASDCGSIWFKSKDLAQQAIEILGEETIKLALEPLGI